MSKSNKDPKQKNVESGVKLFEEKSRKSVPANRSPTRQKSINKSLLSLDKTQEFSETSQKLKIDGENRSENHRNAVILSGYSSRRVQYKKNELEEGAVNVDADVVKNDRTLRDEDWFLEKIEKCRAKKLQRICVCPLPRCYRITDAFDRFKGTWHRVKHVVFVACCPPCCCIIQRSAFWPPRREYYFFKPPPDDVIIEVNDEAEAILMQNRKKKLKKLKKAKKCVIGEYYQFGLSHPCADDVKYVRGFVLKTKNKNKIGCVYVGCPDGFAPRFTLLYSHPNGSDLSDHLIGIPSLIDIARFYRCEVYSYDYTGYGISGGIASESNLYSDIQAIYEHITLEKRVDPKKIVLLGYSIGSAATIELLRHEQDQKPAGVILQAPPTSILRVIGGMMGRTKHLEKKTCCIDRFVTIDKIHEIQIPILVIHGKADKTVPVEHGKLICQRAITKVAPEWVPGAAHDNVENCREVWRRVRRFVKVELNLK
ncbi:Serine aminopeptidase S33 domain-containing protein [Caenorhabditis elegans]|uniref:Serine aminopeptidase S33 domain-containing protein n=1 Tax=Caenorhabditis elegans TaxID=6239 RepID=Q5FC17_CAEEL|nr:Serine aminopeptidase S33 domain-containing protein [Caenorhabditis elegans]CAI46625.2 Serine aminopeptidase S33 domain-containing protein [Caenorhabditis elegans]|eukprot:NP_001023462.2 Uncharacterized protein CELE_Y41E3.18 [Caenorhabditis elegans]